MKGFLAALKQHYATIPVPPEKLPDVALLAQLWADQFQHLTTLALAGGGGLLVCCRPERYKPKFLGGARAVRAGGHPQRGRSDIRSG